VEREAQAVSTSAVQAASPEWKQEVNRRLAEHKGRKAAPHAEPHCPAESASAASRRAQEAAARVAARYAKAPSYSEVLAAEARAALRAAEAAQQAALQATAAVQTILAGFESTVANELAAAPQVVTPRRAEAVVLAPAVPLPAIEERVQSPTASAIAIAVEEEDGFSKPSAPRPVVTGEAVSVRWAPELPVRAMEPVEFHAGRGDSLFEEAWWMPSSAEPVAPGGGEVEVVEPAQAIAGNIIEFPRELVAARKARPRLAEAPFAAAGSGAQLSIFEVDPALLPAEPAIETPEEAARTWIEPTWSGIELDAQPAAGMEAATEEATPATAAAPELHAAAINRRLMAVLVDAALLCGGVLAAAITSLHNSRVVPGVHVAEMGLGVALVVTAALYYGLFSALSRATPGMKYARIELSTFEGRMPTRAQRCSRLMAIVLSVAPLGLGLVWILFDDENLCWHDRLSRTYLRQA
jgi:uncharacterized RDD family membrane protein YckC